MSAMVATAQWWLVVSAFVASDMMLAMVNSLGAAPPLTDVQLVAAYLLAFSVFLCYDELAKN